MRLSVSTVLSVCFCAILVSLSSVSVSAHEVRPAYLELRQTGTETYDVLWKVPALGQDMRLGLYVEFPSGTTNVTTPRMELANGASTERWSVSRAGGLTGGTINISGLKATLTDVLVRLERLDGSTQVTRLTPSEPSFVVADAPSNFEVAATYVQLGIHHILTGIDHLLFVLALLIITGWSWQLLKTITAFTLAHSLTLGLATLGFVHVPQQPVEAVIALSIVFVAAEIVSSRQGNSSLTKRYPWLIAFTFGLLHGFGFAGALSEVGLPQQAIPVALVFFNIGVEVGQLLFIALILVLFAVARQITKRISIPQPGWAWRVPPYAIGGIAAFWVIQRIASFY